MSKIVDINTDRFWLVALSLANVGCGGRTGLLDSQRTEIIGTDAGTTICGSQVPRCIVPMQACAASRRVKPACDADARSQTFDIERCQNDSGNPLGREPLHEIDLTLEIIFLQRTFPDHFDAELQLPAEFAIVAALCRARFIS